MFGTRLKYFSVIWLKKKTLLGAGKHHGLPLVNIHSLYSFYVPMVHNQSCSYQMFGLPLHIQLVYILHERVNVRWSTPQFDGRVTLLLNPYLMVKQCFKLVRLQCIYMYSFVYLYIYIYVLWWLLCPVLWIEMDGKHGWKSTINGGLNWKINYMNYKSTINQW